MKKYFLLYQNLYIMAVLFPSKPGPLQNIGERKSIKPHSRKPEPSKMADNDDYRTSIVIIAQENHR